MMRLRLHLPRKVAPYPLGSPASPRPRSVHLLVPRRRSPRSVQRRRTRLREVIADKARTPISKSANACRYRRRYDPRPRWRHPAVPPPIPPWNKDACCHRAVSPDVAMGARKAGQPAVPRCSTLAAAYRAGLRPADLVRLPDLDALEARAWCSRSWKSTARYWPLQGDSRSRPAGRSCLAP